MKTKQERYAKLQEMSKDQLIDIILLLEQSITKIGGDATTKKEAS